MKTILIFLLCIYCHQAYSVTIFRVLKPASDLSDKFTKQTISQIDIDPNVAPERPPSQVEETTDSIDSDPIENEVVDQADEEAPVVNAVSDAADIVSSSPSVNVDSKPVNVDDKNPINKYCKCTENYCDCCRNFALPIIPVRGPGCARISYNGKEKMSVQIKYGDIILASRTVSGKNSEPICVNLPGGYSKFCGIVYGLSKTKDDFKACLGLQLRAEDEIEAALRVSCFKFGKGGLRVAEAEPLPTPPKNEDDDEDYFGLGGGDDEDDEEEDTYDDDATDTDDYEDAVADNDATDSDYGGIGGLASGLLFEDDEDEDEESAEEVASVSPAASRNDPEIAENIGEVTTAKSKTKKSKRKDDDDYDEGVVYQLLSGLVSYFS